jgi:hypothetical protein
MKDDELVDGFERGTLEPGAFGHREHVRVAWVYLTRHGRDEAARRMLDGLRAFAARAGKPSKFDAPLTLAWMAAIDEARQATPAAATFEQLVTARPALLDRAGLSIGRV